MVHPDIRSREQAKGEMSLFQHARTDAELRGVAAHDMVLTEAYSNPLQKRNFGNQCADDKHVNLYCYSLESVDQRLHVFPTVFGKMIFLS